MVLPFELDGSIRAGTPRELVDGPVPTPSRNYDISPEGDRFVMVRAVAEGESDPAALAALGDRQLHATPEQLRDALGAAADLNPVYRQLIGMALEDVRLIEEQIQRLDLEMAGQIRPHRDAVQRLAEVPGLGVDSAQQMIAEVGPTAATFPSPKQPASWVGVCPGAKESAGFNASRRMPNGNRQMRRLLHVAANSAVKTKGSIFQLAYRRLVPQRRDRRTARSASTVSSSTIPGCSGSTFLPATNQSRAAS